MTRHTVLLSTLSFIVLSGCASIVSGSTQKVQISTNPPTQSSCAVANKMGSWSIVSPNQIDLSRSKSDLTVNCTDNATGYSGTSAIESELEPWLLGNIIIGGIVGAPIDFATGAAWLYPASVVVPLKPTYQPASAYPTPGTTYMQPTINAPAPQPMTPPTAPIQPQ